MNRFVWASRTLSTFIALCAIAPAQGAISIPSKIDHVQSFAIGLSGYSSGAVIQVTIKDAANHQYTVNVTIGADGTGSTDWTVPGEMSECYFSASTAATVHRFVE